MVLKSLLVLLLLSSCGGEAPKEKEQFKTAPPDMQHQMDENYA